MRFRRVRSPLHAVEATIAALHEELEFTTNFAHAMVREENYQAAADVLEEQRHSLAQAAGSIERALRAPEAQRTRMRTRAAVAGVAAALVLGSGAFAAFGPGSAPPTQAKIEAIEEMSEALEAAVAISDPITLSAIVAPAQERILAAAQGAAADPEIKASLLDSVEKLQKVIGNPHLPGEVRERAKEVAETVQQIVVSAPDVPAVVDPVVEESSDVGSAETDPTSEAPTP